VASGDGGVCHCEDHQVMACRPTSAPNSTSKSSFERTRQFYRKHGYSEVAHIPDFFANGDGKASFVKRM